ncbi:MAG: hypothetical protein HWN67_06605 [Candidatus Helarchaeota archaeon]|nr:hypothetical protein [Candidatus Helarchaeota archaeon]
MADLEFLYGLIVGLLVKAPPPRNPLGMIIGISIIVASIVIATMFARDLGEQMTSDTSKALWGIAFYIIPVVSWIGYYFVVKRGRSISKSSKL